MAYVLVKYFHVIGILLLVSMLVIEHMSLKQEMTPGEIGKLAFIDMIYGMAAGVVLIAGLSLWFLVGKGSSFYSANPVFLAKVGLFVLTGLLSIYPTRFYIKSRASAEETVAMPKMVILLVRMQLLLLLVIPLLAVTMAQGYGLN